MLRVERQLDNKAEANDVVEVRELLHKKLDIGVFIQARSESGDVARRLEKDVRDIFHTIKQMQGSGGGGGHVFQQRKV